MNRVFVAATLLGVLTFPLSLRADSPPSAERGRELLLTKSYVPPLWTARAYANIAQQWPSSSTELSFEERLRERYGLHPAPYPNNNLPMGLRYDSFLGIRGLAIDCMLCHGGSIGGKSYVGLGNTSLDLQALFEEFTKADGRRHVLPYQMCNTRGTNEAGATSVFLLSHRNPDLSLQRKAYDLKLKDDLCEDVPAWWILKKKRTMYYTGGADVRSVRSIMQFMMSPLNSPQVFQSREVDFRHIQAYILSLEAPKYPHPINRELAQQGEKLFLTHCASCHGTYGENPTYPNRIIPIDEIGTDRKRFDGISYAFGEHYNRSWFAQERPGWFLDEYQVRATPGYQAPPLDGIWATAPYLHNGSVPTLEHLLNSKSRPKVFTRSFRTDWDAYDTQAVGWKVQEVDPRSITPQDPIERRKIYDTSQPGRSNTGHTYGDVLSDDERRAVIEYLKTL